MSKGRTIRPTPAGKNPGRRKRQAVALEPVVPDGRAGPLSARPVMLLVLGPHRSGTSVVTRLLECLGARNSPNLNPPNFANPKGYFEDWDIYQFNENVLLPRLGLSWHSIGFVDWSRLNKADRSRLGLHALEIVRRNYPATQPLSVLKEPRIGVLLPFWLSVLGHAGFDVRIVCAVRDPVSIARSLAARDKFSITHGGMLYVTSWLSILPHLEDQPVALAEFDAVFSQPGKVLRSVAEKLHLPLPADLDECLHEFASNHLDPSLRHSRLPAEDVALEPDLPPLAAHLHEALVSAARSQNIKKAARVALASDRTIEAFRPVLADFDQLLAVTRDRRPAPEAAVPVAPVPVADTGATEALTRERDELVAQLAETQAAREELAARLAAAEMVRQETAARQAALAEATARLAAAEQELQELRANAEQHAQERDARTQLEELERCHEDLAKRHRALFEERAALEDERRHLLARVEEVCAEREAHATRLNEVEAARQELAARHAALQNTHGEMAARAAELDGLRHELSARQAVLADAQAKLAAAEQTLSEARTAREQTEAEIKDKTEESDLLLTQLHQVQEELEKYFLENRELKQSADQLRTTKDAHQALTALHQELADSHAQLVTRNEALRSDHASLSSRLAALVAERDDVATRHSSLVAAMEELRGQHAALVAEHDRLERSSREERARLTDEAQKLGRELEGQARRVRALEDVAAQRLQDLAKLGAVVVQKAAALEELATVAAYSGENNFRIRRIEVLDSHETPPHRHLNLVLHDVSLAGRDFDRLPVRLVEHHGRAGLAFLRPPDLPDPPLQGWIESGRDGDMSYMLVIPSNAAAQAWLQAAGGSDLYFVRFLASTLDDVLLNRYAHCPPAGWEAARVRKWLPVARALVQQLEQMPARLHYDRALVAPGTQPGSWSFDLSNVFFAGRAVARVACEWRPEAHGQRGEMLLRLAEASAAPLLAWPHHDDHTPAPEVTLAFEPAAWNLARRTNGSTLQASDEDFLRSLAAELPALTEKLAAEQGLAAREKNHLLKLARRAAASGRLHLSD